MAALSGNSVRFRDLESIDYLHTEHNNVTWLFTSAVERFDGDWKYDDFTSRLFLRVAQ